MLLIHDIVEIDAGDTFAYDVKGHEDKREREVKAASRLFGILPDDQRSDCLALWEEFEAKATAEAKYAACLDRLQPLLLNYYNQGAAWRKHGVTSERVLAYNQHMEQGSATLWQFAQCLINNAVDQGYFSGSKA